MPEGGRKRGERRKDHEARASAHTGNPKESFRWYQGTIKCFDEKKGYGFIKCPEAFAEYQSDVFVHHKNFHGLYIGESVQFKLQVNARGQPQAIDLQECDPGDPAPRTAEDAHEQRVVGAAREGAGHGGGGDGPRGLVDAGDAASLPYLGTIKLVDGAKGFGFIRCEESYSAYERDVFVPQSLMQGLHEGDPVHFSVRLGRDGKPQASDISLPYPHVSAHAQLHGIAGDVMDPYTCLDQPSGNVTEYEGTVKKIDSQRGYGFVACQALFDIYGSDVFASLTQISRFAVGDHVRFVPRTNRKGQPQATKLTLCGPSAEVPNDAEAAEAERESATMTGTIKSFDAENGYGFISSPEVLERYGRDVFLHAKQIKGFQPSDHVAFSVRINGQGQPQAYGLRAAPRTVAWLAAGGDDDAPEPEGAAEHVGEIKSFSSSHGYGFIGCPALRDVYGRDVFIHQSQFEGLSVGDRVSFRVQVKRGQPQACDVALHAASAPEPAPPGPAAERGPGLNRQLLRACASARVESLASVQELLASRADPDARDVAGHAALMVSAVNPRHGERKCRLLIEHRADPSARYNDTTSIIQWARERINPQFAEYLEGLKDGKHIDYTVALEIPRDTD